MNPHCIDFKPSPTASWICAWWDWEHIEDNKIEWHCSRPAWEEVVCLTEGRRNLPENQLVENVREQDCGEGED